MINKLFDNDNKQALFMEAFIDFISIFANENIGNEVRLNYKEIFDYLSSDIFTFETWDIKSIEDCYFYIEGWVLSGFPLWRFMHLSDWTKTMLEKEFEIRLEDERIKALKKYRCLTCRNFVQNETCFGTAYKCNYKSEHDEHNWRYRDYEFNPYVVRNNCKGYIKVNNK